MANLKVSALKDLTGAQGFMLAGGGITATTTLTVSNIIITVKFVVEPRMLYHLKVVTQVKHLSLLVVDLFGLLLSLDLV